eukprot:TRINITY_DN815_c0_g6_i1.p1 TRINITY_DN815_c0_g6~~TRINITY_DN815_c0_g6_i1.p1  ORF type:complete len:949 (-),score=336.03 TRINITY_DN815_c0_g6_i1:196-3042(-)
MSGTPPNRVASTTRTMYTGRTTPASGLPPVGSPNTPTTGASRVVRQPSTVAPGTGFAGAVPNRGQPPQIASRVARVDPSTGQPQPAYGQPSAYGQQTSAYGQQQPAYGQQSAYGQQQPAYGQQQPVGVSRVARSGTGNSVPNAIPVRAPSRVAGASPGMSGAPTLPPSRVPSRVAADPTATLSGPGAMAPARSSSRSVSAHDAPAAPTPRAVMRARRVSKIIVEKEKKTDYWQEIVQAAKAEADLSQDDVNNLISRAMALDIVGNWKQRESTAAPNARELFQILETQMETRITELNGGRPVSVAGRGIEKIRLMEPILAQLEATKEKETEQEEEKVKAKVGELQTSLRAMQEKKETEIANKRKTMSLELNNLREQMARAAQEPSQAATQDAQALAEKMNRLEAALRLMNEERKKGVEDKETLLLKKKLAVFEAKLIEVAENKKLAAAEDQGSALREKLLLMEEKLQKMERRKSVSITMMMQQKMQEVENQLQSLRIQGGGGGSNNDSKVAALEKKLLELQNTKVTPAMVNDAETNALRAHVKKLEESMRLAESKMDEQRMRVEQERMLAWKKRQEEEEEYRKKARMREEMLLQKMAEMEKRIAQGSRGGPPPPPGMGGGGGIDAAMAKRLEEMEKRMMANANSSNPMQDRLLEMEKRLKDTEAALQKEKSTSQLFMEALGQKEGPELEAAHKDIQIAMLKQQTEMLMKKLEESTQAMESKISSITSKVENMKFVSGGGPSVPQSGLTYAEINAKLEEIQAKLFDENTPEKEAEALNIEYEKLISEMEQTPEYIAEQVELANKWKRENEPLNNAALESARAKLANMAPAARTTLLGRKPELKFLGFTPEQIMKKHVNDFKGVTTQNLDETEARALYACMPAFRKDQEKQLEFVEQLKNKIEIEVKKPKTKPPPPIQAAKKVVFKKPPPGAGGGGGGFLDELLKKRKQLD